LGTAVVNKERSHYGESLCDLAPAVPATPFLCQKGIREAQIDWTSTGLLLKMKEGID
jgi:hypothetical protein